MPSLALTGLPSVALCASKPVPQWVLDALPGLPATMQESARRAGRYENAVLDLAEAAALLILRKKASAIWGGEEDA